MEAQIKDLWQKTQSAIVRNQKIIVTVILVLGAICLIYYQARATKTIGRVVPLTVPKNNESQYHVDFPNKKIVVQTNDKMMKTPEQDLDTCRKLCEDTDWCHFWEHNPLDGECSLYKAISRDSNYEASIVPNDGSHVGVFEKKLTE